MALVWAAVGWAAGLALGPAAGLPIPSWLTLFGASTAWAISFRRNIVHLTLFGCLAIAFLGAARAEAARPRATTTDVRSFNDVPVPLTIRGVVVGIPVVRGRTLRVTFHSDEVARRSDGPWLKAPGLLQLETTEPVTLSYGDRLQVRGWLSTPRNSLLFAQADILARDGIFSVLETHEVERLSVDQADPILGFFYRLRQHSLRSLAAALPPEEATLVGGVVLGADESMPPHLQQAFARTGTTHILAVSGFNVALVAGAFGALFGRWLGARRGALAAALAIGGYTLMVGAEPSAVRASLMAGLAIVARLMGRRGNALTSLAATGMIMTAVRPSLLVDIGFQLSFAATLGLVMFAEPFEHAVLTWFHPDPDRPPAPLLGFVREVVLLTLAAQVATLPLTAFYFGRLPATALPANFLILPLQPALMVLGSLTALAGMVWAPAGTLLGWITYPLAAYNLRVVEAFAALPLASLAVGRPSPWAVVIAYAALLAVAAGWQAVRAGVKLPASVPGWVRLAALAVLASLLWRDVLDLPTSHLQAVLFPSGDVLVESPSGRFVLLRPASGAVLPAADLGRRLPITAAAFDWMILPAADSVEGFLAARPGQRLLPGGVLYSGEAPDLSALAGGREIASQSLYPHLQLDLADGCVLEVLALSDRGEAVEVSLGHARLLILSGLNFNSIGSGAPVSPSVVLADNSGRLAGVQGVQLAAAAGPPLELAPGQSMLDTDRHGWIAIRTDGKRLWVEAER